MHDKKKIIKKIFTFLIFNICIFHKNNAFCENKTHNNNDCLQKFCLYQKYNKNFCKHLKKFSSNQSSIKKRSNTYLSTNYNSLSEIQISSNFANLKNIYFKNYNQLIFHQLTYHFINENKIYNFGLGYRYACHNQWITGNNIFYSTLLSPLKNNKNILSIGNEFLKGSTHITINTYHKITDSNFISVNKKHPLFAYDIHIKKHLPFLMYTYATINVEQYFNNKDQQNIYKYHQQMDTAEKHFFNKNTYKMILGLIYTPTPMFTFNINKVIICNSTKNNEMKLNIISNYKIHIPWIYPKKKTDKYQYTSFNKKHSVKNNDYTIHKNYSIILLSPEEINVKNTKTKHTNYKNIKHVDTINTKDILEKTVLETNHDNDYNVNNEKKTILHTENNTNQESQKINIIPFDKKSYVSPEPNSQKTIPSNDINHIISIKNNDVRINTNYESSLKTIDNNNQPIFSENIDHSKPSCSQETQLHILEKSKTIQNQSHNTNTEKSNIPPPPPMPKFLEINSNTNNPKINQINLKTYVVNTDNSQNEPEKNKKIIEQYRNNKFSSLGSEEYLSKLNNNLLQKRKKKISTSSCDSNDSESIRILRIIERQSIFKTNDNTDSDDTDSVTSDNDFSE